jgi:hypothetical protein
MRSNGAGMWPSKPSTSTCSPGDLKLTVYLANNTSRAPPQSKFVVRVQAAVVLSGDHAELEPPRPPLVIEVSVTSPWAST